MQIIPPEKGYPEFVRFRTPAMRWVLAIATWVGMLSFFFSLAWLTYLSQVSPDAPDTTTGQVVELNNHGRFYVRATAALVFNLSCWGGWMLGALGIVAGMSVFGPEQGHSRAFNYVGVAVVACGIVLVGVSIFTNGHFPFDMASLP